MTLYAGQVGVVRADGLLDSPGVLVFDVDRVADHNSREDAAHVIFKPELLTMGGLKAALLPVRERVLGPEHPDTLRARRRLARWTGEAGDAAGARDQCAALVPIHERVLGPEHPDTLTIRANLADWTRETGAQVDEVTDRRRLHRLRA